MGLQAGFKRSSCTRTRYGAAALAVDPAWVKVHPTGVRKIIITSGLEVGITAEVRFKATFDVRPGDFLYFSAFDLSLYVYQIIPEQATSRALCQEVPQFIPDEFDRQIVEQFWKVTENGGSIVADEFGRLNINMPDPSVDEFGNGSRLTQTLTGDFDVYAKIEGIAPGGSYYAVEGLIAYLDSTHYCGAVKVHDSSAAPNQHWFARVDKVDTSYDGETEPQGFLGSYLRLRRSGNVLTCLASSSIADFGPVSEDEWAVLESTGDRFFSDDPLEVGLCGYRVGAAQEVEYECIKNWVATSTASTLDGFLKTGMTAYFADREHRFRFIVNTHFGRT
jgi:hypothetical protein